MFLKCTRSVVAIQHCKTTPDFMMTKCTFSQTSNIKRSLESKKFDRVVSDCALFWCSGKRSSDSIMPNWLSKRLMLMFICSFFSMLDCSEHWKLGVQLKGQQKIPTIATGCSLCIEQGGHCCKQLCLWMFVTGLISESIVTSNKLFLGGWHGVEAKRDHKDGLGCWRIFPAPFTETEHFLASFPSSFLFTGCDFR